jgi:hypothetical protein
LVDRGDLGVEEVDLAQPGVDSLALADRQLLLGQPPASLDPEEVPSTVRTRTARETLGARKACGRITRRPALRAQNELVILTSGGDRCGGAADLETRRNRIVAEPLDPVQTDGVLLVNDVGGQDVVADEQRSVGPDKDIAHPMAVPDPPLLSDTVELSVHDPDRSAEGTVLARDPSAPREHEADDRGDDDQVAAKDSEQGDQHVFSPGSSVE